MSTWAINDSRNGSLCSGRDWVTCRRRSVFRRSLHKGPAVMPCCEGCRRRGFFKGVRKFYPPTSHKPFTAAFRGVESASGRSLGRFFERWVEGTTFRG